MPTDYNKYGVLRSEGMIVGPNNSYAIVFDDQDGFRIVRAPFSSAPEEVVAYDAQGTPGTLTAVIDLGRDELLALNDSELVVALPGIPGIIYDVDRVVTTTSFGAIPWPVNLDIFLQINSDDLTEDSVVASDTSDMQYSYTISRARDDEDIVDRAGQPATFVVSSGGHTVTGGVGEVSVSSGGADYVIGDTFEVDGGYINAQGVVTAVSSGAVTGVSITYVGAGYEVATGVATIATSGIGTGLELDIETLVPFTNTARVWIVYRKLPVTV